MNVPFVSLKYMHDEIEKEALSKMQEVYKNNCYIGGEEVEEFEKEFADYCSVKYCVSCANGLDALYLALCAWGIGPGDEVILPCNTFIATALAVSYTGATPVLVDSNEYYLLDAELTEKHITPRTKAIIPVHLYGQCADMSAFRNLSEKYGLKLLEDSAQAHGATFYEQSAGSMGDAAGFSFYPGKNLGALGDGGALLTNDKTMAEKVRAIANYGADYKYHHIYMGNNSRLDTMQAAFLRLKLQNLNRWNMRRREIADRYSAGITNPIITMPQTCDGNAHVWHVYAVRTPQRDALQQYLKENQIGTLIHYPTPIHLQKAYEWLGYNEGDFPNSEEYANQLLSLPMFYGISDKEVDYVIDACNAYQ